MLCQRSRVPGVGGNPALQVLVFDTGTSCSSFLTDISRGHRPLWVFVTMSPSHRCVLIPNQWCGVRSDAAQPPMVTNLSTLIYNFRHWKLGKGQGRFWWSRE